VLAPRICLCIAEDDLRTWVKDEVMLMTWVGTPTIVIIDELEPVDANVIVVGVDRLSARDREALRDRTWTTPVITIGKGGDLSSRLTSRELKQAIRARLGAAQSSKSAAG
jgi:hypothetical protein